MENKHYSRKQRQLKYLVKQLNNLLQKTNADLKSEIKKMTAKIKHLVSQLSGIVNANRMKRILGTTALLIGISFTNTASAQWFAYPIQDPFNLQDGNDNEVNSPEFADIDNDGDLDYLSGEYTYNYSYYGGGGYSLGFHFQENIGSATNPNFANPIINPFGLVDYNPTNLSARNQYHKFIDMDNDGDFDILSNVVNFDYSTYSLISDFIYYENIGTPSTPQFTVPTTNQFGLTSSASMLFTTFGDIDGDGDIDILGFSSDMSSYNMNFLFIENTGTTSAPNFATPQLNVFGIPSGVFSFLTLEDIDNDGDLDIIFTEENYYVTDFGYVENTGTATTPQFTPPPTINPFGLSFSNWQGRGILNFKDLDGDGDNDLIVGTDDDKNYYLENVGTQQAITYECINYACVDPGTGSGTYTTLSACQTSCAPPVTFECDWYTVGCSDPADGSGNYGSLQDCQNACGVTPTWDCDATLGCVDPGTGTGLYTSLAGCQSNCTSTSIENKEINNLKIYPNPVNNTLNVSSDKKIKKIEIYDTLGRVIYAESNPSSAINVEQLESGLYSIAIIFDDNRIVKKFTK